MKILTNDGQPPKKTPHGAYDHILCLPCEQVFSDCDDYMYTLLTKTLYQIKDHPGGEKLMIYANPNVEMMNKFVVGVLFRASVSEKYQINFGPYKDEITEFLNGNAKFPSIIEYVIFYSNDDVDSLIYPLNGRIEGMNFYWFSTGRHHFYVKIDKRGMIEGLNEFSNHSNALTVIQLEKNKSKSYELLQSLVKENDKFIK